MERRGGISESRT